MNEKGMCKKHGEFILAEGCPGCLAEKLGPQEPPKDYRIFRGSPNEFFERAATSTPEISAAEPVPTATVKIAPDKDAGYIKLLAETTKLLEYSTKLVIKDVDDKKAATNDLIIMGDLGKEIEVVKKEWLGPIDEHRKTVFDMFRQLTDPLAQAIRQTKAAMTEYDREQERIRLELEEIARKERELEEAKARAENRAPVEIKTVAIPEQDTGRTRSELGLASTVTTYKANVVDFKLLSDDYKMPDMAKLNRVVNAAKGKIEIPGVEIETEHNLRTYRRAR